MRKRDHSLPTNVASLLICGILAGIVVAAAAFPAIAMAGLAAKAGAHTFGELPSALNVPTPPQITYLYASDNKTLLGTFYDENRRDIPLTDVPQVMRDAIIAAEDQRFYQHHGVDLQGIIRAFAANQQSGQAQGASTLTMQYVRQAITYSATSPSEIIAATEHTNARKLREMRYAIELETVLSKDQILERYLNIASFGHGAWGIYAAAQVYFNKEPKDLTLPEAALLAALPKAPTAFDPVTEEGRPQALERRNWILGQMVETGKITAKEAEAAQRADLKIYGRHTPRGCESTVVAHWGFFCDYMYRWWVNQEAFGESPSERENRLKAGGYRIVTTLDVAIQAAAKKNVEAQLKTGSSDALMVAAVEPGTGAIKAMAVNRVFGLDTSKNGPSSDPAKRRKGIKGTYPTTTNQLIGGGGDISGYKAGSTYKIFTTLAALEKGFTLDFTIQAVSPYPSPIYIVGTNDVSVCPDRRHWCPENANPSYMNGKRDMWAGFGRSVNTYYVPLQEKVGAENAIAMAKRLGVQFRNSKDIEKTSNKTLAHFFGPFTIGVTDSVPLELGNAYATLAADGKHCTPIPVAQVFNNKGVLLPDIGKPSCTQAVKPDVARAALDAARCPVYDRGGLGRCTGGTAGQYFSNGKAGGLTPAQAIGHPIYGKTGTTDNYWTANLVVSTKRLTVAATYANPDYAETAHSSSIAHQANLAAVNTLRDAMKGKSKQDFPKPSNNMVVGKKVTVPGDLICKSVASASEKIKAVGLDVQVMDKPIDSTCPEGTVAKVEPTGTTSKGGTVLIYVSNGHPPAGPTPSPAPILGGVDQPPPLPPWVPPGRRDRSPWPWPRH